MRKKWLLGLHRLLRILMNKKISVFNDDQNIENSIKSILNQTYENYEFLIINDGSTHKTRSICSSYASKSENIGYLLRRK